MYKHVVTMQMALSWGGAREFICWVLGLGWGVFLAKE